MNVELLQKVKKHIREEPLRLFMVAFEARQTPLLHDLPDIFNNRRPFPACGSAGCIGGWAAILSGKSGNFTDHEKLLDLNFVQSAKLFNPRNWPAQFQRGTWDDGSREAAEICAARIDFFIQTKGTDDESYLVATS